MAGRSDATLNRGGVRLGTAEFYAVVEELGGIADSLVVHLEDPEDGNGELCCSWRWNPARGWTSSCARSVTTVLRTSLSPRHIPDQITAVPVIPRNLTGKKLELPVKRILQGSLLNRWPAATRLPYPPRWTHSLRWPAPVPRKSRPS